MPRTRLLAAYAATAYRVTTPAGEFALRLGVADAGLAAWMHAAGIVALHILTAYNPHSRRADDAANAAQQAALLTAVRRAGRPCLAGCNVADGDWPPEPTCVLLDAPAAEARALGREFGQDAIVGVDADGRAGVIWLD